jgi:hypothetical protein
LTGNAESGDFDDKIGPAWFARLAGIAVGASKLATFEGLPSDHYLKLVGAGSKMIRGEMAWADDLPKLEAANPKK